MQRINFEVPQLDNSELIAQLKQNKELIGLMIRKGIPVELLERTPLRFKNWMEDLEKCRGCKCLADCRQSTPGKRRDLNYDVILETVISDCPYLRDQNKNRSHLSNYLVNDMGEHLYEAEAGKIDLSNESSAYNAIVFMVMQNILNQGDKGLYLYGPVGTGKTYLAACAANAFAKQNKKVVFVHVPSFAGRIRSQVTTNEYQLEVNRIMRADFAVFDDLGAESVTPWFRDDVLLPILNHRMEQGKMTWFTSNEDLKSLKSVYAMGGKQAVEEMKAVRLVERVETLAKPVELLGKDRRK